MRWIEDVRSELRALDQSPRALRKFALLVGGVLVLLGAWKVHVLAAVGALLIAAGLLAPRALKPVQTAWMALALTLGWFMSRVLLTVVFFVAVIPIALLRGRRALGEEPRTSYWVKRTGRSDYTKMH